MEKALFIEVMPEGEGVDPELLNVSDIVRVTGTTSATLYLRNGDNLVVSHSYVDIRALLRPFSVLLDINGAPLV